MYKFPAKAGKNVTGKTKDRLFPLGVMDAPAIAMLGYRLWRDYFNANPNVVGSPIQLNGQAFTVVGILPPDFRLPGWADLWLPQGQAGDEITNPVRHGFGVIARLKPGMPASKADAASMWPSIRARPIVVTQDVWARVQPNSFSSGSTNTLQA